MVCFFPALPHVDSHQQYVQVNNANNLLAHIGYNMLRGPAFIRASPVPVGTSQADVAEKL